MPRSTTARGVSAIVAALASILRPIGSLARRERSEIPIVGVPGRKRPRECVARASTGQLARPVDALQQRIQVVVGVRVGGLVMVGDHGRERLLVLRDAIKLAAPEIGEQHRVVAGFGERCDPVGVELLFEHRLERDLRPFESTRGDGRAGESIGVDMRDE